MQIRNMLIGDYEELYALWTSCAGMGLNNLDDSPNGISKFLNRNPETCFVALADGKIVGAIMVGNDGRRGYIYHTAVHADYRKRGIGRALVEAALSSLRRLGINKVALVVFARNESANEFWRKIGFTTREDLVYRNKNIVEFTRIDT